MALKHAFAIMICALALGGSAWADDYRPGEYLNLDLPKAVLSPKRLGPPTEFAPVAVEARTDAVLAKPKKVVTKRVHVVEKPRAPARTKLVRRHSNPLDANALDTRIQTWPCKSGGICNWKR